MFNKKIIASALIGSLAFSLFPTNIFANEDTEQKICKFLENNRDYGISYLFKDNENNIYTLFSSDKAKEIETNGETEYGYLGIFTKNGEIIKDKYISGGLNSGKLSPDGIEIKNGILIDYSRNTNENLANGISVSKEEYKNIRLSNGRTYMSQGYIYNDKIYMGEGGILYRYDLDKDDDDSIYPYKYETKEKILEGHTIIKIENNDIYTEDFPHVYKNGKIFFTLNNQDNRFLYIDNENNIYSYEKEYNSDKIHLKIFKNGIILTETYLDFLNDNIKDYDFFFVDKNNNYYFFSDKNFYKNGKPICKNLENNSNNSGNSSNDNTNSQTKNNLTSAPVDISKISPKNDSRVNTGSSSNYTKIEETKKEEKISENKKSENNSLTENEKNSIKTLVENIFKKYSNNKNLLENLNKALTTREDIQKMAETNPRVKFVIEEFKKQYLNFMIQL